MNFYSINLNTFYLRRFFKNCLATVRLRKQRPVHEEPTQGHRRLSDLEDDLPKGQRSKSDHAELRVGGSERSEEKSTRKTELGGVESGGRMSRQANTLRTRGPDRGRGRENRFGG